MGAKQKGVKITSQVAIKPKSIEYLQENSMLAKAEKVSYSSLLSFDMI